MTTRKRCSWAISEPNTSYHDSEWGVAVHDDRLFFEMLTLEGAQAGLSWTTILKKRAGYRALFADFNVASVAAFTSEHIDAVVGDARIVRHRGKIEATVSNARALLAVQHEFGSFDRYIWAFVDGKPIVSRRPAGEPPPATSELSDRVSRNLKKRGFRFVGSTIIYALLQATGIVDDHDVTCFRATPLHGVR